MPLNLTAVTRSFHHFSLSWVLNCYNCFSYYVFFKIYWNAPKYDGVSAIYNVTINIFCFIEERVVFFFCFGPTQKAQSSITQVGLWTINLSLYVAPWVTESLLLWLELRGLSNKISLIQVTIISWRQLKTLAAPWIQMESYSLSN